MKMNKLILGTAQFGLDYGINNRCGRVSDIELKKILDYSYKSGVRLLDTAEVYGNSHERIGAYHRSSNYNFKIITKFHATSQIDETFSIKERVLNNLNNLHVENLYCYMFHSFSNYKKYFSFFKDELLDLKLNKVIDKIGVSVYTNEELIEVVENNEIGLIQLPYNLLDNHIQRGEAILKAKEKEIEIHIRSVFLQGLFFKKIKELPVTLRSLMPYLRTLHDLCKDEYKMNELALTYVNNKDYIDKVLIGVDNIQHLQDNLLSINKSIQDKLVNQIESIKVKETELLNPSNW